MRASPAGTPPDDASAVTATAMEQRFATVPWWRRPRRLRRQLATALMITALLAVITFGGLNFFAARELLLRGTETQLAASGAARAATVAAGAERLISEVSVTSSTQALAQALDEFSTAFDALDRRKLTKRQRDQLAAWYESQIIEPFEAAGLGPIALADLYPTTSAAQWLQYHYTMRGADEPAPVDPGDATRYTRLNKRYEPAIRALSDQRGGGDILLIDTSGTIVYSLHKGIDVGTSLVSGPYADSTLGRVVTEALPRARVGTTLLTDFSVSSAGQPELFAVSAVRSGPRLVGALAAGVPVEALNRITTASVGSQDVDEGKADSYIVAADRVLQSEPRSWAEDPQAYVARLQAGDEADQEQARLIELFGSPVGIQVIDTDPVEAALAGADFQGAASSPFGEATYSASTAFSPGGRQWVVVTEVPRGTVNEPLLDYLRRIGVVLAVVLPIVGAAGIWISRVFTKPIRPTVLAAEAIVAGDREPDVDTTRGDEFGDLARRLTSMARALATHEQELVEEYERTRQLLLAVLPTQLVDADGNIVGTGEAMETATAVAVTIAPTYPDEDQEQAREALGHAAEVAEVIAAAVGLERVRVSTDRYLYLAGIGSADSGADRAIDFASQLRARIEVGGAEVSLDLHVGLSSGVVATGVFDSGSLTFGAWGDPVRRALALASLAQVDSVLVDASTAQAATSPWPLARAHDVVDLDDEPMDLFTLEAAGLEGAARP